MSWAVSPYLVVVSNIAVSILGDQPSILMITKKYIRLSSIMSHHGLKQTEGLGPSNTSFCCSPECFGKVSKIVPPFA